MKLAAIAPHTLSLSPNLSTEDQRLIESANAALGRQDYLSAGSLLGRVSNLTYKTVQFERVRAALTDFPTNAGMGRFNKFDRGFRGRCI